MLRQPKTLKVNKKTQSSQKHKKHVIAKKQTKRNIQTLVNTKRITSRNTARPAFNKTLKNINSNNNNNNNTFASLITNNQEFSFLQQPPTPATMMQQNKSFFSTTSFAPTRHAHYAAFQKSRALFNDNKDKQQAEINDATQNTEQQQQQETSDVTSSKTGRKQYKSNRPKVESATFMQRCKTALSKQTYESPISKAIKDLPPLGDTAYLTEDNEEWELVYKTGLRNSLYYVKKMSITSFLGGTLAVPFIFLFPNEAVPLSARLALAAGCLVFGVGTTIVTNVYCSAAITQAFINKRYPNIMEITTAGFTGNRESFRFDVTEPTTDNVDNIMMSWKHLESGRYFWNNEVLVRHPVWGLIIPHLFVVPEEEEERQAATAAEQEAANAVVAEQQDQSQTVEVPQTEQEQTTTSTIQQPGDSEQQQQQPRPTRSQKFAQLKQQVATSQDQQVQQQIETIAQSIPQDVIADAKITPPQTENNKQ